MEEQIHAQAVVETKRKNRHPAAAALLLLSPPLLSPSYGIYGGRVGEKRKKKKKKKARTTGDATRIDSWPSESRSAGCVHPALL